MAALWCFWAATTPSGIRQWVTDPDGNRWEVCTVLEDIEREAEASTAC